MVMLNGKEMPFWVGVGPPSLTSAAETPGRWMRIY